MIAGLAARVTRNSRLHRLHESSLIFLVLLFLFLQTGCSSEGGVVGSGISSVQGNVIDVQLEMDTLAAGAGGTEDDLVPVVVSIDGTGLQTAIDSDGYFSLEGSFAGAVTVRFSDPNDGESLGTFDTEVASGATVFLRDVEIRRDLNLEQAVIVHEPLDLNAAGMIRDLDCAGGKIVFIDDSTQGNLFTLRLNAATELLDSNGQARNCADLEPGAEILLEEGVLNLDDGIIDAVKLIADSRRRPRAQAQFEVLRGGTVLSVNCDNRLVYFMDTELHDLVRLELTSATRLVCATEESCSCGSIRAGEIIEVHATRHIARAGQLIASEVLIEPNPAAFIQRVVTGDVASIDCEAGLATILDVRLTRRQAASSVVGGPQFEVALSPDTQYLCGARNPRPCGCENVVQGSRVELQAKIPLSAGQPVALRVTVVANPFISMPGEIVSVDCDNGELVIQRALGELMRANLSADTTIHHGQNEHLSCSDLQLGQTVIIQGALVFGGSTMPIIHAAEVSVRHSSTMGDDR